MAALHLEHLTWPEVKAELAAGRETIVVPLGSLEQHGRHLPLGTDAFLGDGLGLALAERLGAFLAPTVRLGCSEHHLAFPGTITLRTETFVQVVRDVVRSLSGHGFKRIILLPTHGGNFGPLAEAVEGLEPGEKVRVIAFTDLDGLVASSLEESDRLGVSPAEAGVHAGEWETSMLLVLRPELVKLDKAVPGFVGDWAEIKAKVFEGIQALDENGVLGDPRPATAEAGQRYIKVLIDLVAGAIETA